MVTNSIQMQLTRRFNSGQ